MNFLNFYYFILLILGLFAFIEHYNKEKSKFISMYHDTCIYDVNILSNICYQFDNLFYINLCKKTYKNTNATTYKIHII